MSAINQLTGPGQYNMEKYPKRLARGVSMSQILPLPEQKGILIDHVP